MQGSGGGGERSDSETMNREEDEARNAREEKRRRREQIRFGLIVMCKRGPTFSHLETASRLIDTIRTHGRTNRLINFRCHQEIAQLFDA